MFDILFFGSTSDFASNTFISFNAIYFRSTIYCTAVDHYWLVPLDLMRSREAGTKFVSSPCKPKKVGFCDLPQLKQPKPFTKANLKGALD